MDEVRKSIKVFVEDIRKKIQDNSPIMSEIDTTLQEDENIEYPSISMEQQLQNQKLIDVEIALSKAEIKPYNNEEFLAQIFVETQERKDIIDSIRKDLTQFIIKRTHYPHMKLDVIALNPEERQNIPTTPVERFTFLMRESPAINLLKENFKCEIKY